VAEVTGNPDACPFVLARRLDLGREPACLALASRDERPCAGAPDERTRITCTATATHDTSPCGALVPVDDQQHCIDDEQLWARAIPAAPPRPPALVRGMASVEGDMMGAGWEFDVSHGVVPVEAVDGTHIAFGGSPGTPAVVSAEAPASEWIRAEVVVPRDTGKGRVARYEVNVPRELQAVVSAMDASRLHVSVYELERRRGGRVDLSVDGPIAYDASSGARLRTFVRDIVP
jgi:hypothetical protein